MQAIQRLSPIVRAVGIIGAVAVLTTSITFAALSDSVSITSNTVTTATADLNIWDGSDYSGTRTGFDIDDLVPGEGSEVIRFFLQNESSFDMEIFVSVPTAPDLTASGVASLSDVLITFYDENLNEIITTNLEDLTTGSVSIGDLSAGASGRGSVGTGQEGNYAISFDLDPNGVSGTQADVPAFDFVFTGTQK